MTTEQQARDRKAAQALIDQVRAAGLVDAADLFSNAYWGFIRLMDAYRHGLPYVDQPEKAGLSRPSGAMHVATYTANHWAPLVLGSAIVDNAAVLREDAADEAWHRAEDRRMRIEAGEDIL